MTVEPSPEMLRQKGHEWLEHLKSSVVKVPRLLQVRRWLYRIPDSFFAIAPVNERIQIFQVGEDDGDTYGDTSILKPDTVKARERGEAARGIITGAGPDALNWMITNGLSLGHMVRVIEDYPYSLDLGRTCGQSFRALSLRASDIVASEDIARMMQEEGLEMHNQSDEGEMDHVYFMNAEPFNPHLTTIPAAELEEYLSLGGPRNAIR